MTTELKPCRSPYCECDQGRCTHPGFYDARAEELEEPDFLAGVQACDRNDPECEACQ